MSDTNIPLRAANVHKNEVHLAGELAKDPVIHYTSSGKAVANLTLVTKREKFSEFHRIVLWEGLAEKAADRKKGDFLRIVGRLQTRSWDDKATGQKKYTTEVVAFQVSIPADDPAPLTPDMNRKGGTNVARAILRPAKEASDGDPAF
jgi:single stranded DNA-binding protein